MARVFALFLVGLPVLALGEVDAGAQVGVLTKPPALLKQVEAQFPPEMLDAGQGGTVTMELDLGPDGKVMDARVVESAGEAFDRSALTAVRQFEFSAAEVDQVPAAVRLRYSYTFFFKQQVIEVPLEVDAGTSTTLFSGTLVERGTRDPIANAQIVVGEGDTPIEGLSDDAGHFELSVPLGHHRVVVIAPESYRYEVAEDFAAGQRTEVTYYVRKKLYGGFETVVRGQKERKEVAQVTLKQQEIRLIPGTNGDAFRVVQNLPGVARTPFGIGFLIVRGGKPWDTTTYIDEAFVPVLFHFGGLYATYNSYMLEDLSFQAGNFDTEFGRGIGGLVKATARTPSQKGLHGYFDVNVVDTSALLETPINDDWSIAVAGRRSYIDVLLPAIFSLVPGANDAISFTVAPRYYDYQVRVEWKPKKGHSRFYATFFGSSDELAAALPNPAFDPEGRGTFGTSIFYNRLQVGFDTELTKRVSFHTRNSIGFDGFSLSAGSDLFITSKVAPLQSRDVFTIELPEVDLTLTTGLDLYAFPYNVKAQFIPLPKLDQIPDPFASRRLISEDRTVFQAEPGLFVEAMWKPVDGLKVMGGLRGDYDSLMGKGWVDPRLSVLWQLNERFTVKGAAGLYHQPPDYRTGQLSAKFGNPNLLPEGAEQFMVGGEVHFTDAISLDLQLYDKELFHQSRPTTSEGSGADLSQSAADVHWKSIGKARSYGAELLLRHALTKNFFGWVAYSLSRAERDYNGGTQWGLSPFDQTHNLIVVASYKLPYDFIVGARFRYTTGPLTTPYVGAIYDASGNYFFPLPGKLFSRRLPAFAQLDVRIDKRFVFEKWMLAAYIDVQNVTNRDNVEAVIYNYDYSKERYLTGLPILPVLGMRGEW